MRLHSILLSITVGLSSVGLGAEADPDFNRDIRPILSDKCYRCHGPDDQERKGGQDGLRLDTLKGATEDLGGGGYAIVPGDPENSELLWRVNSEDEEEIMPPSDSGKTLSKAEIELLTRWIAGGAKYAQHWSYETPRRATLPEVNDNAWPKGPIDRFILSKLEEAGLPPQPEADRAILARRVALDLTGLPPTIEEVDAFVRERSADAYERFVDRQLAKPTYGEHWARSWLDRARYADSKGYADDQPRSIWRYRDYVIDALNSNMPFDQFTIEQLAGDLLPNPTEDQMVATGFHRNTMNNTEGGTDNEEFRSAAVVDRVNTTMAVWMGTSMACAQCHTHKYDPLTQTEYFQMYAILNQTEDADRTDEMPLLEFYTEEQEKQRREWESEIADIARKLMAAKSAHVAAAERWATEFPTQIDWQFPEPASVKSAGKAVTTVQADGRILVTPGHEKDKVTVELPVASGEPITALRLETLPHESLPGQGAGAGENGNFVVTRFRVAVKPAEPVRRGRYVRIELPGKERSLPLAEVEIFSRGQNVASRGVATQSSTADGAGASRAIDGVTDGDVAMNSVSQTETSDDPWWEIDLRATEPLQRVVVWGRTGLEPTPRGLRIVVLDEQKQVVWETTAKDGPEPSREFKLGAPVEVKLSDVVADFAQPDLDETFIISDARPKVPNPRKRSATEKGWGVEGDTRRAHALSVQPGESLTLGPGETLVITIEQQSDSPNATLNHFRIGTTTDSRAADHLSVPPEELAAIRTPTGERDARQRDQLLDYYILHVAPEFQSEQKRIAELEESLREMKIQTTLVMRELPPDKQRKTHIQLRGSYLVLGDEVTAGVPAAFHPLPEGVTANRLTLARWLVDEDNPLTARVQANRLWAGIFGVGIVRTAEEFGSQGELPTHPELLDWLALDLVESNWDTKRLLKSLVMSAAYRQSSKVTPEALAADPENRLLSRGPRFRLSAEMVRDQALAVSGLLSPRMHGPSSRPYQPAFGLRAAFGSGLDWTTSKGEDRWRRALYTEWRRSNPYPSMVAFDAPNREVCTLRRNRSNTPLQALVTLNDPVYMEAAQALAHRMAGVDGTIEDKAGYGFRRVLIRAPKQAELDQVLGLYRDAIEVYTAAPEKAAELVANPELPPPASCAPVELAAWTVVANVLLNLDEALMKP